MRRDYIVSCHGKRIFRSWNAAARVLKRRRVRDGMMIYRCRYCPYFHLGHGVAD